MSLNVGWESSRMALMDLLSPLLFSPISHLHPPPVFFSFCLNFPQIPFSPLSPFYSFCLANFIPESFKMSNFPIVRSNSYIVYPRARDFHTGEAMVPTLSRVSSVPNIHNMHVSDAFRPSTLYKYRRDWNPLDAHITDSSHHSPLYWANRRFAARRQMNTDPIPDSLGLDYPNFWSRYKFYSDYLEPKYWRRHRDPNYDRPLWNSWKPYILDGKNQKQAIDMYRQGLVSFAYLDKNWITPWALGRKEKDWADVYPPAGKYGARRYMYSWA